jgi:hypothetical protein
MYRVESIGDPTDYEHTASGSRLQAMIDDFADRVGTGFMTFLGLAPAFAVIFAAALSIAAA